MNANKFTKFWLLLFIVPLVFITSCEDDEDPIAEPVASFQFTVDPDEDGSFLKVAFGNFSTNSESYAWNFGDTNTSTDESPTHTYEAAGDYTITLTATGTDGSTSEKIETLSITDPDTQLTLLAGLTSKEWIAQREGAVWYVGPSQTAYDGSWWTLSEGHAARACAFDDVYTFERAGTFLKNTNGTFFLDSRANGGWNENLNGGGEGCVDESTEGAFTDSSTNGDYSALADGGSYTYEYDNASGNITITGAGAYMVVPKVANGGDVGAQAALPEQLTYKVVKLVEGPVADSLHIHHNPDGGDGYWTFKLVSYHNASDIPTFDPYADFSYEVDVLDVTFTNNSVGATTYTWDFGDGGSSTDENPSHTYAADGTYAVILTASDGSGTGSTTKDVVIDNANPAEAAPTPTEDAANVIAIYSDAYTAISGVDTNPAWGQATVLTEETVAGDNVLKVAGLNYQGIDWSGNKQDVSGKTMLHVDIWSAGAETINFSLISDGLENAITLTTEAGTWKSFDIPLTDYTVPNLTEVMQFKFDDAGTGTSPTIFVDNMYFY